MIDVTEIVTRLINQIIENGSDRVDEKRGDYQFSVYWAGSVLRVDIKGLR